MLYAKIVLGLAVEGPFDYIVPANFYKKIKVGARVWVPLRTMRILGYVVKLTRKTNIKNLKTILEVIDDAAILDKNMLSLTKELSDYYCCSWGEAIETALPTDLREGKLLPKIENRPPPVSNLGSALSKDKEIILIHDLDGTKRWDIYIQEIKAALGINKSVIILLPDINSVLKAEEIIKARLDCPLGILYRRQPQELEEWIKVKTGRVKITIGTRSNIFAPFNNLGLIIIEEEQDNSYKQDQVPHYHAREVGFMRVNIEKVKLILGSSLPSLESFYLAKKLKIKYIFIPRERNFPEVKLIDMRWQHYKFKQILSNFLKDAILSTLNLSGKVLLFLNRRGFATVASCRNCGIALKCSRCNINLVYHFKDNLLSCHYCNFKMPAPQICPNCNSGYIRYLGVGTEKVESELSRLFPQVRIKRLENQKQAGINDADIFISTKSIIKGINYTESSELSRVEPGFRNDASENSNIRENFNLIAVLSIDNSLNRVDFRSSEKTFGLLLGLLGLTEKKLVIQTGLTHHHCFKALINKNIDMFYDEELRQRKQLNFPPYKHIGLVKLRGKKEDRVKDASNALFKKLNNHNKRRGIEMVSVNRSQPSKLRGNFYWQILIKSASAKKISKFLKIHLKDFPHSGLIVTVDIDPL